MKLTFTFLLFLLNLPLPAQVQISGRVTNPKSGPLVGVNVFLKDTYEGGSTDADGRFSFTATEKGRQVLVASMVGYREMRREVELAETSLVVDLVLQEAVNTLSGVTITAGSFEASDSKKNVMLRPLDIITTASAAGDLVGALNTLPGTQRNGETGRLFVRGGESREARLFIDGLYVHNPFQPSAPNLPRRTRFSPMIFRGTNFSTGGYSAEYGQALSSTLALQTIDYPARTQTDMALMTLGASVAHTQYSERTSVTFDGSYTNLAPYFRLVPQQYPAEKAPELAEGSLNFRQKMGKIGLLKVYSLASTSVMALRQPNPADIDQDRRIGLHNSYFYLNSSYKHTFGSKLSLRSGAAFTLTDDQIEPGSIRLRQREKSLHAKTAFSYFLHEKISLNSGVEWLAQQYSQQLAEHPASAWNSRETHENLVAGYVETDVYLSNRLAARVGGRLEYSGLLRQGNVAPRVNLAYKTGAFSQVSLAYGKFYQSPNWEWLMAKADLDFERADHYIFNFQRIREGRVFRVETYYKTYDGLVKFDDSRAYNSAGYGYARGLDVFWRDNTSLKNTDYWVSYSLLDTKRNYRDFPGLQTPTFASAHNLSVVVKHFISSLKSQVGFTSSLTSGRPYRDPNRPGEAMPQTPLYFDLSLSWSYLYRPNFIFHASVSNVTGHDNTFGYLYNPRPDANGVYQRKAIGQGAPRFIFFGVFFTLSKDKNANQLNNL
jgi:hypothetical protein